MKHTLLYISLLIVALVIVAAMIGKPRPTAIRLMSAAIPEATKTDTAVRHSEALQAELNYYFDRHNVQDEGYELVGAFAQGQRLEATLPSHFSPMNIGQWHNRRPLGGAVMADSLGRIILCDCHDDSLATGIRIDSLGTYQGDFVRLQASGHGAYTSPDSYFEGHWEGDSKNGFGLELLNADSKPKLRVGHWVKNRHQGERMRYTSERIYGIDIARYQHEKGRRKFPIHWDKLRITSVGKKGSHNVRGTADYPVSFIYIKSTEGTTVRNRYFVHDYAAAHKHGIAVGAYHFFSTRTSGADQAKHFLRNTVFKPGDLPPVLDIEPSKSQIQQMGGPERMFYHIRVWIKAVEKWCGRKPILYVNQMFVNNYLSEQPDLKRDYRIWIARYSEYKPDFRLTYWQLCPDGRVEGITGDVDINVFNGYATQFEDFLQQETLN